MSYVVTMGQAFDSKRMESFDTMQQVIQSNPDSFPMMADIFFRNSDLAGADQLADRFKKLLPPQLQDQEESLSRHRLRRRFSSFTASAGHQCCRWRV
jgi:hypothetical protein